MQRVKTAYAVPNKPPYSTSGVPGYFTSGNPLTAQPPTVPGAEWFNMTQEELCNLILAAGLELDPEDDTQLAQAIAALIANLVASHNTDGDAHADIRALINGLGGARLETLWLGAGAMIASTTNGAQASTIQSTNYALMEDVLDYSNTVDQSAQAILKLPANWDRGTVRVRLHWRPAVAGATSGQVVGWLVSAGAVGDADTVDRALGAAVTVADNVLAGLHAAEHVSAASTALTVGGVPQVGDRLQLKIVRDAGYAVGGDAMPVAARLLGVEIQYTISGAVAAWA